MKVFVEGASSMIGRYVCEEFKDDELIFPDMEEGKEISESHIRELVNSVEGGLDLVVYCHTPEELPTLLRVLEKRPPRALVVVSGYEVYGLAGGEMIGENSLGRREESAGGKDFSEERSERGVRMLDMEVAAAEWVRDHPETTLTILRPARVFGKGMSGECARMFAEVVAGRYIHIRGEEAGISLVTALDVARSVRCLYTAGGVYNLCDDHPVTWLELAEGMSANAGKYRRPMVLPAPWASAAYRFLGWLPVVREQLNPVRLADRRVSFILDNSRAKDAGMSFYDTLAVIRREAGDYPYQDQ